MIKKFYRILRCNINMELERVLLYKMPCLFEFFADFIPIIVMQYVWTAGYSSSLMSNELKLNEMYIYTLITLGLTSIYGNSVIEKLSRKVIKGDIVCDLLKPINIYIIYLLDDLSRIIKFTIIRFIPIMILSTVIFNLSFDFVHLDYIMPFFLMIIFGYIIMFDLSYIASLLSAWIINVYTCRFMINQIFKVFSGAIIPLWMWGSFGNILNVTPFPYIIANPVSYFLGERNIDSLNVIIIQIIWIIIFKFFIYFIYKKFRKRLNIQGG